MCWHPGMLQPPLPTHVSQRLPAPPSFPDDQSPCLRLLHPSSPLHSNTDMNDLHQTLLLPKVAPSSLTASDWLLGSPVQSWLENAAARPLTPSDLRPVSETDSAEHSDIPYNGGVLRSLFTQYQLQLTLLVGISVSVVALTFVSLYVLYVCTGLLGTTTGNWGLASIVGYVCAAAGLLGLEVTAVAVQQTVSVRVMAGLSVLLHDKLMRCVASNEPQSVVGLVQLDLPRVAMYVPAMTEIPGAVVSVGSVTVFLVWKWGKGCIAGFAVYVLSFLTCYFLEQRASRQLTGMIECAEQRLTLVSELISCVKGIKLNAWEQLFEGRVAQQRDAELKCQQGYLIRRCGVKGVELLSPVVAALSLLGANSYFSVSTLDTTEVYATLVAFGLLQTHLAVLVHYIGYALQLLSSSRRINVTSTQAFLQLPEAACIPLSPAQSPGLISLHNASFCLTPMAQPFLSNLSLTISPGEFVAVTGQTASGKSSLLRALIGEMQLTAGEAAVHGSIAYASSIDTYMANTSIRENILFGRPFNQQRYTQAVKVCSLLHDFGSFVAGDRTEVGEKGGNLSGGQKARIALARAVYRDCEIYLFDDPLAGVDTEVSSRIFADCMVAELTGKTRVMVTHNRAFLRMVDKVVVMEHGTVVSVETPSDSAVSLSVSSDCESTALTDAVDGPKDSGKLISSEEPGGSSVKTYTKYWRHAGGLLVTSLVLCCFLACICTDLYSWASLREFSHDLTVSSFVQFAAMRVCGVGGLMLTLWVCYAGCRKAARGVHGEVVGRVVRAPVAGYFEVTPKGRVLNTLSKDLYGVDNILPMELSSAVTMLNSLLTSFGVTIYLIPQGAICILLIFLLMWHFGRTYILISRELTRLSQVCRSQLVSVFTETLHGLTVLRCFQAQEHRRNALSAALNPLTQAQLSTSLCYCWVKVRLQTLYSCFVLILLSVLLTWKSEFQPGDAALLFTSTISLSGIMMGVVMVAGSLTTVSVSLERVLSLAK